MRWILLWREHACVGVERCDCCMFKREENGEEGGVAMERGGRGDRTGETEREKRGAWKTSCTYNK